MMVSTRKGITPRLGRKPSPDFALLSTMELFMWITKMHEILLHLSNLSSYLPAILITVGIAVLIGCAVGCMCEPCEEKDDLFHHEVV